MKNFSLFLVFALLLANCNPSVKTPDKKSVSQVPKQETFHYLCTGTEPFWSVEISAQGIVFQSPEIAPVMYPYATPDINEAGTIFTSVTSGGTSRIKVTITPGACSDGMSDMEYPYVALVERDGQILRGCAREKP